MSRKIISGPEWYPLQIQEGLSAQRKKDAFSKELNLFPPGKVFFTELTLPDNPVYKLYKFDNYFVYVHPSIEQDFKTHFTPFLKDNQIIYDNLINICIMVKNAGEEFRDILTQNLPYMDRYTILDTGSTDNTIAIIKEVLAQKRGELYQEPFINFRDSRNRLLDLAGDYCHFNIMLDDTYVLHGKIREFLDIVRGDDIADSFSLTIEDIDTIYTSNRVTKPPKKLRYINLVHEIIQNNHNISIPCEWGGIKDVNSDYMTERTKNRKQNDIDTLMEMLRTDPNNPRTYYYIADSFICMKDWDNAVKWFKKRIEMGGYKSEIQDSLYYIAVINDFYLNNPWEECFEWYMKCYDVDPSRSESLYFVGDHYKRIGMKNTAFLYLKNAFELGMPEIQMSVRKNIYNFHIPKELASLCYEMGEYQLGEKACRKALEWKDDTITNNWLNIYYHINKSNISNLQKIRLYENKLIVFVSPGGWDNWYGETLRTRGLGGSENFTIRYSEQLVKLGYNVIVFCKCEERKEYEGVIYFPIENYPEFAGTYHIDVVIINRYCEYIAVSVLNNIKTYFVMHDTPRVNDIYILHHNFAGLLLISEWHKKQVLQYYPTCENRAHVISYGIDVTQYPTLSKKKYMFIYPNFPNRGLYQLLLMWPRIIQKYPSAELHTFCNTKNTWCQEYWKDEMDQIDILLQQHKNTITNHGWVNGSTLRQFWATAHIWLYPCTFEETCCLTAWEAAASKTLVVTNHLAALKESVGGRGVIIQGNARNIEWHNIALERMFEVIDNEAEHEYTNRNYAWVINKNFTNVIGNFVDKFIN